MKNPTCCCTEKVADAAPAALRLFVDDTKVRGHPVVELLVGHGRSVSLFGAHVAMELSYVPEPQM